LGTTQRAKTYKKHCIIYRWHYSCTQKSIHDCEINEKIENTKWEIRGRKSKNDIHYDGKKEHGQKTNKIYQTLHRKLLITT